MSKAPPEGPGGSPERSPLEGLFEDLALELEKEDTPLPNATRPPVPTPAPAVRRLKEPAKAPWEGSFAEQALAAVDGGALTPAGTLLSDGDPSHRLTAPYEIPVNELHPWGDDDRVSQLSTLPVTIDELPAEAYPTTVRPAFRAPSKDPFEALQKQLDAARPKREPAPSDGLPTVRRNVLIPEDAKRSGG